MYACMNIFFIHKYEYVYTYIDTYVPNLYILKPLLLQAVADIIRSTLGSRSMLKMLSFLYVYIYIYSLIQMYINICICIQIYLIIFLCISIFQAVADIIRTTLGPRSMLKMLLDPMGGIVMTNDGNCILREVDVSHPAAKVSLNIIKLLYCFFI
jgi:hypothetical protein